MFRVNIFKYLKQSNFINNPILLQNVVKFNFTIGNLTTSQCTSSINLARTFNKSEIHAKDSVFKEKGEVTQSATKNLTDKEYFVHVKNDPDKFGPPQEEEIIDEGDLQEEKYFTEQPSPSQKLRTKQYADIIKTLIKERKIKEAIDVVEIRMIQEDRVKPENYIYNLLLGACGRVGYTKKAFTLYNDMKKRGLQITGGTYTALFNACANSPWPTDGLTHATHLRNIMIEKGYEPNDTNYNVMIKAFGRCGDLQTSFSIVDEMYSKGFKIKNDTINFLLQACISDKEAGFRHALLVWRKLLKQNISPNIYTYNLMLRCIRDCGLGDIEVMQDVISEIVQNEKMIQVSENNDKILLTSSQDRCSDDSWSSDTDLIIHNENVNSTNESKTLVVSPDKTKIADLRPNLMARVAHLGNLISLSEVNKPEERLLLVGGCSGFLENMEQHRCPPDIKTFTQLLDNIPSTLAAEDDLLASMKKFKVKPDIDFYNMLIKKRSIRCDYENARVVLEAMKNRRFLPNIITYGVLALGCKNKEQALELIDEMEAKNYRLNIQILGGMLYQACFHMEIDYVLEIMEICLRLDVHPDKKFMEVLDEFVTKCRKLKNADKLNNYQQKEYKSLKVRYKEWLQRVQVEETEDVHPWQQYRQTNDQNVKHYKWKDGARFKPRHTSRFMIKTSPKHKK